MSWGERFRHSSALAWAVWPSARRHGALRYNGERRDDCPRAVGRRGGAELAVEGNRAFTWAADRWWVHLHDAGGRVGSWPAPARLLWQEASEL
jgi:hypothetical protein